MSGLAPVLVIGAGSWGTALAILLSHNGHPVSLWGNEPAHMARLQTERENAQFLPALPFPPLLQPITDLQAGLQAATTVLLVVPSDAFRSVLTQIAPLLRPDQYLCWATKGLEQGSCPLLHQVAAEVLGANRAVAVVSGPTFAREVGAGLPTAMTVAGSDLDAAQHLASALRNNNCRVYVSTDLVGVQVGAAAKNVIAIAAGIADGLGFGANTRAALITRGLAEIVRLGVALGGRRDTFMGLTGLGDLVLTCTDNQSRNRRYGYALGRGADLLTARAEIGQVVEGIYAAEQVVTLARRLHIELPISEQVNQVLQGHCTPKQAVHTLLSREPKLELGE